MATKKQKRVTLYSNGGYSLPDRMTIPEFRAWLDDLTSNVPAEHVESVWIEFGTEDEQGTLTVAYSRDETTEEVEAREAAAQAFTDRQVAAERAQFERLKAKFGDA